MLSYPENVYKDLAVLPQGTPITIDMKNALEYAVNKMPMNHRYIFNQHYKHGRTFKSIADELQKSNSSVSQINRKSLRFLRKPENIKPILVGIEAYNKQRKEEEELEAKRLADYNARYTEKELQIQLLYGRDVTELGLSTRAVNSMRRAGCNVLRDFIDRFTVYRWYEKIRNCGVNSAQEIFDKLVELGVWGGTCENPTLIKPEIKYSLTRLEALRSADNETALKILTEFAGVVRASSNIPFFTTERVKQYFDAFVDPKY